jgi:hypothetical protein
MVCLNAIYFWAQGSVVAAFFSSNLGDVSPNIRGPRCEFSGKECDNQFLLCGAWERCYALGPGEDMFDSVKIIGQAIYEGAMVSVFILLMSPLLGHRPSLHALISDLVGSADRNIL